MATMTAWLPYCCGEPGDDGRVGQRGGVQAHLVRPRLDHRRGIVGIADAAADAQRDEQLAGDRADGARHGQPLFERRRDVEDHQLVDAFDVVAPRERGRVAGGAEALELDALDDLPVADVEARDDALGQHQRAT